MTKELTGSCDTCATTVVTKSPQTPFRLPFEAKIVSSLVFFATSVSIYRTSILLRHFDANYGVRSLQADQSPPAKLRIRVQNRDSNYARVVLWNENADRIFPLKAASTFKLSKAKLFHAIDDEYDDKNDNDVGIDPTRLYDQSDSADLPTLERPNGQIMSLIRIVYQQHLGKLHSTQLVMKYIPMLT